MMSNKKIYIIAVLVFLVVLLSAAFVFINNRPVAVLTEPDTGRAKDNFIDLLSRTSEGYEKINQEYLERESDDQIILARHRKLSEEDCDLLKTEEETADCRMFIKLENDIGKMDISLCQNYNGGWKDACILMSNFAKLSEWETCREIEDEMLHDWCIKKFSIENNDTSLCLRLFSGVEACNDRTRAINNDWGGDLLECKDIGKTEYFLMCANMSQDPCEKLQDEYLIKRCESVRLYSAILMKGEKEHCAALPLERFRITCELYFDNGKKHVDTDGDGVNNGMELFVDTNPLVAEEEAATHAWYEDRWEGAFDNIYFRTKTLVKDLQIDTDDDGLSDYEEKEIYKTDPENRDTDGDGYWDGDEVRRGFNPLGEGRL